LLLWLLDAQGSLDESRGRGFYLSPHLFEAITDEVEISGARWHLKNVPLPGDFVCHLALAREAPIGVQFVNVNTLTNYLL
jgi:hypothetical protein